MDTYQAIITRRSTRNYQQTLPEEEALWKILEAARYAPSGGNNQFCHFFVICDKNVLDDLAQLVQQEFAQMQDSENIYASMRRSIQRSKKGDYRFCYNAPILIAVANRIGYENNIADSAAAIENMMIMANALDLGTCWINQLKWLNENPRLLQYLRSLGLKDNERVYGSMILGVPAAENGLPSREPLPRKGNEVTFIG